MRERRQVRPRLEPLESMALLSGATAAVIAPAPGGAITLSGKENVFFVEHQSNPDVGRQYHMFGPGRVSPFGRELTVGDLNVVGFIQHGPPSGTLHLTTPRGSLTLQIPFAVIDPPGLPNPSSSNSIVDTYRISGGTGAFKGDTGQGVVEFTFHPRGPISPNGFTSGRVTIDFMTFPTAANS